MSVQYRSWSIIGVSFDNSLLYRPEKVKTFDHKFPETQERHPDTGMPLWGMWKREIPEFKDGKLGEYKILEDTEEGIAYCVLFSGEDYEGCSHRKFVKIPDNFQTEKNQMQKYLSKLGLWTDTFGLHTVLYYV